MYLETLILQFKNKLTVITVVSGVACLTHTLTADRVTAKRVVLAFASGDAALAPETRPTCCNTHEGES